MVGPSVAGITATRFGRGARIVDRAGELSSFDDRMEDDLVVHRVQRVDSGFRIGKIPGVPRELPVSCVPARRRELGAQIDQGVAGQPLLSKGARNAQHFLGTGEGAVGLHVSEGPSCGQLRIASDDGVFAEQHRRIAGGHDEDVERQQGGRGEATLGAGEVECPERLVDIQTPTLGADYPLNRDARAVCVQPVSVLTVPHLVRRTSSIELRTAFTERKQGATAEKKRKGVGGEVRAQLLDDAAVCSDADCEILSDVQPNALPKGGSLVRRASPAAAATRAAPGLRPRGPAIWTRLPVLPSQAAEG